MTAEHRSKEPSMTPGGDALPSPGRRRLFRGAAGGAGVLLSVHAKTALGGGICKSPSAMMSGNASPRPGDGSVCSGGRSPGFWKQPKHSSYWTQAGAAFPTFSGVVDTCSVGLPALTLADMTNPGTLFSGIFLGTVTVASGVTRPSGLAIGIWEALAFPNNFDGGQLMRHLSAAWLNAGLFASSAQKYPLTRAQIVDMWNATKSGGLYCPGSMVGGCGANGWTAAQVIAYIDQMYDINDGLGPDLCKTS